MMMMVSHGALHLNWQGPRMLLHTSGHSPPSGLLLTKREICCLMLPGICLQLALVTQAELLAVSRSDLFHVCCGLFLRLGCRGFLAAFGFLGFLPGRLGSRWGRLVRHRLPAAIASLIHYVLLFHIHKLDACWGLALQDVCSFMHSLSLTPSPRTAVERCSPLGSVRLQNPVPATLHALKSVPMNDAEQRLYDLLDMHASGKGIQRRHLCCFCMLQWPEQHTSAMMRRSSSSFCMVF